MVYSLYTRLNSPFASLHFAAYTPHLGRKIDDPRWFHVPRSEGWDEGRQYHEANTKLSMARSEVDVRFVGTDCLGGWGKPRLLCGDMLALPVLSQH